MPEKQRVRVQSTEPGIILGKSKRLAAMRQSTEIQKASVLPRNSLNSGTNNREYKIMQARDLIAQNIIIIKSQYPRAKQNKLFELRYGSEDKINHLSLQQLYSLLSITSEIDKDIGDVKYGNG